MGILPFWEANGDQSTWSISISSEQGKSVRQYIFGRGVGDNGGPTLISGLDIQDTLQSLVGTTDVGVTDGRITRRLPRADPTYPGWFVNDVSNLRGTNNPQKGDVRPAVAGSNTTPVDNVIAYFNLTANVTFGPRPYPVLADQTIGPISNSPTGGPWVWKLSTPSNPITGNPTGPDNLPFVVFPEWWRFTAGPTVEPSNSWVTNQFGQMMFVRSNTSLVPHSFVFGGQPRMFLPDDLVTFTLFAIPFRWLTSPNSYIRRLRGLVNQFAWWEGTTQGTYDFPAGSLLYMTFKPSIFSAPTQTPVAWNWAGVQSLPKLCNVDLVFLRTERYAKDPPTPTNSNFIVNGFNAQPWLGGCQPGATVGTNTPLPGGRLFYYATDSGTAGGTPSFISAPIPHLLFQDPDGPNAVQIPQTF